MVVAVVAHYKCIKENELKANGWVWSLCMRFSVYSIVDSKMHLLSVYASFGCGLPAQIIRQCSM